MQSHFGHSEPTFLVDASATTNLIWSVLNPMTYIRYLASGSGPLRTVAGLEAVGFFRTGLHNESWPDVQILFISAHFGSDGGVSAKRNFNLDAEQV
jgi:hypothetical protein